MTKLVRTLPHPADFPAPPSDADRDRWAAADAAARPERLARLRARMAAEGIDAYFGMRPEHMRYLTGFALEDNEEKVSGNSGRFFISADRVVVLAETADVAADIDLERAERARREAEHVLEGGFVEPADLASARAALQRALIRIKVAERGARVTARGEHEAPRRPTHRPHDEPPGE
jgi:F-type H+-transporting ATPase subunit epsilon